MTSRPAFGELGYRVEEAVLGSDEVDELCEVAERVAIRVATRAQRAGAGPERRLADGHRIQFSSRAGIQWEWNEGSEAIRLIEPADHLDPLIDALFSDPRLTAPVCHELGTDALGPFTSKLNLKRAKEGSEFPWHQDFPYWYVAAGERAADVVTAIVFLDDATADNGAVRVLPGSHQLGPASRDPKDPTRFLTDPANLDTSNEVVVEVPAGSVIWFGAFLVHRSSPNTSGRHRRALLPSWQPAGRPRLHDLDYIPERVEDLP
ncbi:MAG TPA: phytanoyl-CoA dioxygenase family protein [Acidimicrobiales bacterium]|nr:phytanoyl-CoA dioxygenase family protein [Acidimicrobiales bacterium]